jgi:glycolate oxidase iron-sulfur subunit
VNPADVEKGLMSCVHCGFCLDACPTYRATGDEADSPRGRILMMRRVQEGTLAFDPKEGNSAGTVGYHLDRCLGCRACETACPSAVPYGHLLEHFRDEQERAISRPMGESLLRNSMLHLLTHPNKMKMALQAGKITRGAIPGPIAQFVGLPDDTRMPLPDNLSQSSAPLPEITPAVGKKRGRVALLSGCVMRVLYGPVHQATAFVLAQNGIEVHCPKNQNCCGALHGHQGKLTTAKEYARSLIAQMEDDEYEAILLNSAGCGSFIKGYGHLLQDDPHWADRAHAFAAKVKDISEYLSEIELIPMWGSVNARVTYHDACHLCHGQKIKDQPRELLKAIPGIEFVESVDSDQCCGSAGIYNYLEPEMARVLLQKKLDNLLATNADIVATGNPGCLAWIQQGISEGIFPDDIKIPKVVHPIELLQRAYRR